MSLNLVLSYEASALAAPQSFRDGMQAAANILNSLIQDNITVTIQVGYGDWYNNYDTGLTTGAEGGVLAGSYVSYSTLRTALATHETSALDQSVVNSLPAATSVSGYSNLWVSSAVEKALGLISPTAATLDGAVGIGTQISGSLLVGVALHEITHAMGRVPNNDTLNLVRYTSAGNHLFTTGATAPPAYFSIDGGYTKLADFGQASDPSDFLNSGVQGSTDPFNEFYSWSTNQSLSTVDKQIMDATGFNLTPPTPVVIESFGLTTLNQVGLNYSLVTASTTLSIKYGGANVVAGQFGTWVPIGAEQIGSGYDIAWKVAGANQYSVWSADANGNYTGNLVDAYSPGTSYALESLETTFHQDLNGDGTIGIVTVVIETAGLTTLSQTAGNFLMTTGTTSVSIKYGGAVVTVGAFGGWTPIGAEQVGSGYDIAWKVAGANQYSVWSTDANGNYAGNLVDAYSPGTSYALESLETTFHQDLNGDGTIGIPNVAIETAGLTALNQVGGNFMMTTGTTNVSIKYGGAIVTVGAFSGWTPIGAEQVGSGYDIAWKVTGANQYSVWSADANGNYTGNLVDSYSPGSSLALESLETTFHQDLNGDGTIGIPNVAIETAGLTALNQVGGNFMMTTGTTSVSIKYGGAIVTVGAFGGWTPIGAEQVGSGYDIAWKVTGANQYSVWSADANGNYTGNLVDSYSPGSSLALESLETTFHQDLNGDGIIGVPPSVTAFQTGPSSATSSFDGSMVALTFGPASSINATLVGFSGDGTLAGSNQVDLRELSAAKLQSNFDASTGVLSVSDGTHTANLQFFGVHAEDSFRFVDDGAGGTAIYVAPAVAGTSGTPASTVATLAGEAFVFAPNFGQATLAHFDPATDTLRINHNVFANVNAFLAAAHDDGTGNVVVVDSLHDTLSIQHVTLAQLQAHQNGFHIV